MALPIFIRFAASICGVILILSGTSVEDARAQMSPDVLHGVPSSYALVSVLNVQHFVQSPFYSKLEQGTPTIGVMADCLAAMARYTGVDPAKEVSYLLVANKQGYADTISSLLVATGRFNKKQIARHVRAQSVRPDAVYRGVKLMDVTVLNSNKDPIPLRIGMPSDNEIVLGMDIYVREYLDAKAGTLMNIQSNSVMAPLIGAAPHGESLWYVGTSKNGLAIAPAPIPTGPYTAAQTVAGAFSIANAVAGRISVTLLNPNTAARILKVHEKIAAVGRMLEGPDAGLKLLGEGVTAGQNGSQLLLNINYQPEDLVRVWKWCTQRAEAVQNRNTKTDVPRPAFGAPGVEYPEILFNPLPPYTEQARKERIQGKVVLRFVIRKDGTADSFQVVQSLGGGLDESAIKTIFTRWRFLPCLRDGVPIDIVADSETVFRLH
jgi:TonB family protein